MKIHFQVKHQFLYQKFKTPSLMFWHVIDNKQTIDGHVEAQERKILWYHALGKKTEDMSKSNSKRRKFIS